MNISKRLQEVVSGVQSQGVVADIGCDHGFTGIALILEGRASAVIAMDINAGPLQRAREHISQYGLEHCMTTRQSDGTEALQPGEADTILISGMGGSLMADILAAKKDVTCSAKELVLSPQSEIYKVRKMLHKLGFCIAQEKMVKDMGKFYTILRCVPGQEIYDDIEYLYGKCLIQLKQPVFSEYIGKEMRRVEKILATLPEQASANSKLQVEKKQLQEVMERLTRSYNTTTNNGKQLEY